MVSSDFISTEHEKRFEGTFLSFLLVTISTVLKGRMQHFSKIEFFGSNGRKISFESAEVAWYTQ